MSNLPYCIQMMLSLSDTEVEFDHSSKWNHCIFINTKFCDMQPSFLGRSSSSSSLPPPAQRHVGSSGNSRSFVFGRDDSNSNHGFPSNPPQEEKVQTVSIESFYIHVLLGSGFKVHDW